MSNLIHDKRGISEIIASLLLILIVVAAGVIIYSYSVTAFSSSSSHFQQQTLLTEEQTRERFLVNRVWWDTSNNLNLTVLNYGKIGINVDTVYINGTAVSGITVTDLDGNGVDFTGVGQLVLVKFTSPISITSGSVYELLVVTERGGKATVYWKA